MPYFPCFEVTEWIDASGGEQNHRCYQCGTCSALCPWGSQTGYSNRKLLMMTQLGAEGIEEHLWGCSTCGLCVERCPREVASIDVVKAIRTAFSEGGMLPAPLRTFTGSMQANGNPWSGDKAERWAWAEGLDLPRYENQEYNWFPCCTLAYDPRNRMVATAQAKLLEAAGVDFGCFGDEMVCCAESLGKIGDTELTDSMRQTNRHLFVENSVSRVLVSSPHCLDTFGKEYDLATLESRHIVGLIQDKLEDGTLKPSVDLGGLKVTYHDPCYLGRHNQVYEKPRMALQALGGVEYLEMPRNRALSYCCGGGGGKMWIEVESGQRPSEERVREALDTGANVLATACPYCISMFEDAVKTLGVEDDIRIVDVSELIAEACAL